MIFLIDFLLFISVAWIVHHLFGLQVQLNPEAWMPDRVMSIATSTRLTPYMAFLKRKMTTANWKMSPRKFFLIQVFMGGGFLASGLLTVIFLQNRLPKFSVFLLSIFLFFSIGFILPLLKLINAVQARQKNMVKDLSYYLDLMTLGVEAGLDYLTVLTKIIENSRPGPLKEELELMIKRVQMGKSRSEAWREFSTRIDLPEIHSLILAFIQTDQTGSPLSDSLLQLSEEIKRKRFQLAEKRAYQMPVKMLIPLLGCIFPAVFILIFEPLILRFLNLF